MRHKLEYESGDQVEPGEVADEHVSKNLNRNQVIKCNLIRQCKSGEQIHIRTSVRSARTSIHGRNSFYKYCLTQIALEPFWGLVELASDAEATFDPFT